MAQLTLAAFVFLGLHFGIAGTPLRTRCVALLGERGYRAAFSTASALGLVWLILAYRDAPYLGLWGTPVWSRLLAITLMPIAFLLAVLGLTTPNPTAVTGEALLTKDVRAVGVLRITRHPFLWGVAWWAALHGVANGDAASLMLFGSLLVLVVGGMFSIDAKRSRTFGERWTRYAEETSMVPFMAIVQGRNRWVWREFKLWQIILALLVYGVTMRFHLAWFGAAPWP